MIILKIHVFYTNPTLNNYIIPAYLLVYFCSQSNYTEYLHTNLKKAETGIQKWRIRTYQFFRISIVAPLNSSKI